jgi:hypothetical protein
MQSPVSNKKEKKKKKKILLLPAATHFLTFFSILRFGGATFVA